MNLTIDSAWYPHLPMKEICLQWKLLYIRGRGCGHIGNKNSKKTPRAIATSIVRVYETEGDSTKVSMGLFKEPSKAYFVDINEEKIVSEGISIDGKTIELTVSPYSIANVCIEF